MSARNEPSQLPGLQRFLDLIKTRQSADKLHVIEEFPKFMVRCFLKSPEYGNIQPFYEQKFMHKFYLNKESWDLLECLDCMPDSRCRCAPALSHIIFFILRFILFYARPYTRAIPDSLFNTVIPCKTLSLKISRGTIRATLNLPVLLNRLSKNTLNRKTCQPSICSL